MFYKISDVKNSLTNQDVFNILESIDANPMWDKDSDGKTLIMSDTICHGGDSHKLVYFCHTQTFFCRTCCGTIGDIFALLQITYSPNLNECVKYVVDNMEEKVINPIEQKKRAERINNKHVDLKYTEIHTLPEYKNPLAKYPQPEILNWKNEGISHEMCINANIRYNPIDGEILIPHYDMNNRLIGIKTRALTEQDAQIGKYRMFRNGDTEYFFPTSFNCYNINNAKETIFRKGNVVVFEGEKSVLKLQSLTNKKDVAAVACSGSFFSRFQIKQLIDCGAKRIWIAFDRDYQNESEPEYRKLLKNYSQLANKYSGNEIEFRFVFLPQCPVHSSPIDCGLNVFNDAIKNAKSSSDVVEMYQN